MSRTPSPKAEVLAPSNRPNRHERRRERTYSALIGAARRVMADKGFGAAAISDITEEADVAMGSFYNHFSSKEELLKAVAQDTLRRLGEDVDRVLVGIEDPARAQAFAWLQAIGSGLADPDTGWFVLRHTYTSEAINEPLRARLERDLILGREAGRFRFTDPRLTSVLINGALSGLLASALRRECEPAALARGVAQILIGLGVGEDEANVIAADALVATGQK